LEKQKKYYFQKKDGEVIKLGNPSRTNFMMINPDTTETKQFSMGITEIDGESSVPSHIHPNEEEILFCYQGKGFITVDEVEYSFKKGATIFVPKDMPHSFRNPYGGKLCYTWVFSPPGFEKALRERVKNLQNMQ
jgi:mannose-6-phosphate isomerase-like protein (cupin superfamily)